MSSPPACRIWLPSQAGIPDSNVSAHLRMVGAIRALERPADTGLVEDLKSADERLRSLDLHVAGGLLDQSLARHLERRGLP